MARLNVEIAVKLMGDAGAGARAAFKGIGTAAQGAAKDVHALEAANVSVTASVSGLQRGYYALQSAMAALGVMQMVRSSVELVTQFERLERTLKIVTGSQAAAGAEMTFLRAESERLGLVLVDTGNAYARFAAASAGSMSMETTRKVFTGIVEVMANLGSSAQDTELALLALQQMMSKGVVASQELRRQLGEHLPRAMQFAAQSIGVTIPKFNKLLEQGKVIAKDFVPGFVETARAALGLSGSIDTTRANLNRLKTALDDLERSFGEGFLSGFMQSFMNLRKAITDQELRQAARDIGASIGSAMRIAVDAVLKLAKAVDELKIALVFLVALKVREWFIVTSAAMTPAVIAAGEVTAAMRLARIGMLSLGEVRLAYQLGFFGAAFKQLAVSILAAVGPLLLVVAAIGVVALAIQSYTKYANLQHGAMMEQLKVQNATRESLSTLADKTREITEAKSKEAKETAMLTKAEGDLMVAQLARLYAMKALADVDFNKAKAAAPTSEPSILQPWRQHEWQDMKDAEGVSKNLDQQIGALLGSIDKYAKAIRGLHPLEGQEKTDKDEQTKAAKNFIDSLERQLAVQKIQAEMGAKVAAAALNGEEAVRQATIATEAAMKIEEEQYRARHAGVQWQERWSTQIRLQTKEISDNGLATKRNNQIFEEGLAARKAGIENLAKIEDAYAGNTRASTIATAAAEAYAKAVGLGYDAENIKKMMDAAKAKAEDAFAAEAHAKAIQDDFEASQRLVAAHAALLDASNRSTAASRASTLVDEIRNKVKESGFSLLSAEGAAIARKVIQQRAETEATERQTAAQLALNDLEDARLQAKADITDWRSQIAAAHTYGSEIAGILEKYGLLSKATKDFTIHQQALADARVKAGTATVEEVEKELRALQSLSDASAREKANFEIAQAARAQFLSDLGTAFGTMSAALGGTSTRLGTIASELGNIANAWSAVTRATASAAEKAKAAAGIVQSIGAIMAQLNIGGSGKTGGPQALGGKLDSNYAGIGSLVGMVIGAAIAAYVSGGSATGGGAALGAALGGVLGSMISKAGDSASASLTASGNVVVGETSRQLDGAVRDALTNIFKSLQIEMASLGLMLEGFPVIDIKVRDNIVRVIVGSVVRTFSSMQDAISFGIAEAVKQAATAGGHLPPEVLAALAHTTATSMDALQSDIAFAQKIANYGIPQVVQALDKAVSEFFVELQRDAQLGIDTTKSIAQFAATVQAQKDQILGINRNLSPADQMRADAAAFNQRVTLLKAQEEADKAMLQVKRADLMAQMAIAQGEVSAARVHAEVARRRLEVDIAIDHAAVDSLATMTAALASIDAAILAAQAVIDSLVTISDQELQDALSHIRGGGSSRASDQQDIRDQVSRLGLSDLANSILDTRKRFGDLSESIRHAGFSEAERQRLLAAAAAGLTAELNRLRDQQLGADRDFVNVGTAAGGQLMQGLQGIDRTQQDLIRANRDLWRQGLLSLHEMRDLNNALREAGEHQRAAMVTGAGNQLLLDLYGYLGMDREAAQMKFDLTVAELQIRRAELELAMRTYGLLDTGLLGRIDDLVGRVIAAGPGIFGQHGDSGGPQMGSTWAAMQAANEAAANASQQASQALAQAAQRLQTAIDGLLEYQRSLRTDSTLGLVNSREALDNARTAYERTKALAGAGDVTAMEQFKDVSATYLRLLQEFSPSSGLVHAAATDVDAFITLLAQRFGAPAAAPYTVDSVTYNAPFGGSPAPPLASGQTVQAQQQAQAAGATEATLRQIGIDIAGMRAEARNQGARILSLEEQTLETQKQVADGMAILRSRAAG